MVHGANYILKRGMRDGGLRNRLDEREQPNITPCHTKVARLGAGRAHDVDLVYGMHSGVKPYGKHLLLELECEGWLNLLSDMT